MTTPREDVYRVLAEIEPCGVCGEGTEYTDLVVWAANGFMHPPTRVTKLYSAGELRVLNKDSKFVPLEKYALICTQCSRGMYEQGIAFDYLKKRAE